VTRRLRLSYLTLVVLVLLSLEIPLGIVYGGAERQRVVRAAEDEAEALAAYARLSLRSDQTAALARRVIHCAERIDGEVFVLDRDGRVRAASRPMSDREARDMLGRRHVRAAMGGRAATDVRTGGYGRVEVLAAAAPVTAGASRSGAVHLTLPTEVVSQRVHRVWLTLAVAGLLVLTAFAGLGLAVARWTGRPIMELEAVTARLARGDLSVRATLATTTGPPEVRRLAGTFNDTAARLEHVMRSQRAFAGEASHQLKTPLAALRLRLDNLEPGIAPGSRANLTAAMTETERLARMVETLLAMARLEEHATAREPVDLDRCARERAATWGPLFASRGCRLTLGGERVGHALAVPGALEQILDNLLSNALRVSGPGTEVRLETRQVRASRRASREARSSWAELHVIDEGPGLPPEQRARAFDRFWRAPGAAAGGSGLGLALVQRLAVAAGGRAALEEAPHGGLDAVVRLPAVPPRPSAPPPRPVDGPRAPWKPRRMADAARARLRPHPGSGRLRRVAPPATPGLTDDFPGHPTPTRAPGGAGPSPRT
jgi:signal transduction histidine kinase